MSKESRSKYLIKNTLIFTIGSFATKVIMFLLVPLYTYVLTTEQFGIIDLISTISMVLAPVLTLNIAESVLRFSLDKDANHNQIMSAGISCLIFAAILGLCIIPIFYMLKLFENYSFFLYFYTISAASSQLFLCYLRGREQLYQYTLGNIINTLCVALFNILFLVVLDKGIEGFLLAYTIANIITSFYAFYCGEVHNIIKNFSFNRKITVSMLKYSIVLIPNVFMWWIMNSMDRVIITAVLGATANGIFAIAYKIPSLMSTIASIFNQAWSYSAIRENDSDDKNDYTNNVYRGLFMVISLSAMGMMIILKPFLNIYVSDAYYIAWKFAPYLIIGFVFQSLGTFLSTPYTVNKDSKGFLLSASFGAITNVVLNYLLVFKFGLYGVSIATCCSYITVFLYRVIDTRKYVKVNVLNKEYIFIIVLLILQAFLINVENIFSSVIQIVLFIIGIMIQHETWLPFFRNIYNKLKSKIGGL